MADRGNYQKCTCGYACSYYVALCDHCHNWRHMACHKLTEDAIKDLKKFYCRLCKSANPHLLAPRRQLPTDEAATYERRHCEDDMPHAVHSLHGVKEQAECVCDKPTECTTSFIQCAVNACKRWCHTECVSLTEEMANRVSKYYCPPCMRKNRRLAIVYRTPQSPPRSIRVQARGRKRAASCIQVSPRRLSEQTPRSTRHASVASSSQRATTSKAALSKKNTLRRTSFTAVQPKLVRQPSPKRARSNAINASVLQAAASAAASPPSESPRKKQRHEERPPPSGNTAGDTARQEPSDFGEAVFQRESQSVLLYKSRTHPGTTCTFRRLRVKSSANPGMFYFVCYQCAVICKDRKLDVRMKLLEVEAGRLRTDPEIVTRDGHGHYCIEAQEQKESFVHEPPAGDAPSEEPLACEAPQLYRRRDETPPSNGESGGDAVQQVPSDFGEAVFEDASRRAILFKSRHYPEQTLKFVLWYVAEENNRKSYYLCSSCLGVCKKRNVYMKSLQVLNGRLMTDPEVTRNEGHGHYCLEDPREDARWTVSFGPRIVQVASQQAQDMQNAIGARVNEVPTAQVVPTEPPRPAADAVPLVQQAAAASTVPKPPLSVAYFGEAVYDRADDPSSFTYNSDLYGAFKFVLLDEEVKERDGQVNVLRLYQCEACLLLSKTHKYRHEQVYTIMTSAKQIVKHDPETPRGLLHLCVRHQRSLSTTE